MKPSKVWVVYGGESVERDVSLNTGKNIVEALKAKGYQTTGIEIKATAELARYFQNDKPDLVFLGLHGTFGEDGTVQGYLDTLKVPYVGCGVLSSAICFNKLITQKILKQHQIPIANFFEVQKESFSVDKILKTRGALILSQKLFIKAASQGSTLGVFRYDPAQYIETERREAFEDLCYKAFQYDSELIVEDWIEGRELTVPVVFAKAFPVIEIRPNSKFYDYQSKYTVGHTEYLCPAPIDAGITARIQECCERVYSILKCADYIRVDVMMRENGEFFVLEVNTLPGMTATSLVPKSAKAQGMSFEDFIDLLVVGSYKRQIL